MASLTLFYCLVLVSALLSCSCRVIRAQEDSILYATDAVSIDECTLHTMDPSSGAASKVIGTVVSRGDNATMGIFGMCFYDGVMYAVNHLDQLVSLDLTTAEATIVGETSTGTNGLYGLACPPSPSSRRRNKVDSAPVYLYTFGAQDSTFAAIDIQTGQAKALEKPLSQSVEAVSMSFDEQGVLWCLINGKELSTVDLTTGALTPHGKLPGVHVNQRHGSIRGRIMYSAFFEADPLDTATVEAVVTTSLDNTYTLAFINGAVAG
jgi:hypothetical protein